MRVGRKKRSPVAREVGGGEVGKNLVAWEVRGEVGGAFPLVNVCALRGRPTFVVV